MSSTLALSVVSYSMAGAVAASGIGETSIREAIAADELVVHYVKSKPVILATDLFEWVESLPTERPER